MKSLLVLGLMITGCCGVDLSQDKFSYADRVQINRGFYAGVRGCVVRVSGEKYDVMVGYRHTLFGLHESNLTRVYDSIACRNLIDGNQYK